MADIEKRKVLDETNLKDFVKTLIAVMEEKGVGGGTGGGGTGAMPIVTITSEASLSGGTDEQFTISYNWTSPNRGSGTVKVYVDNVELESNVRPQGDYQVTVGPFAKGDHQVRITVTDSAKRTSAPALVKIATGGLVLESDFNADTQYQISDDITINYVATVIDYTVPYTMVKTIDGVTTEEEVNIDKGGSNFSWNIGTLTLGVHTVTIQIYRGFQKSNKLVFSVIVGNARSLFIASEFMLNATQEDDETEPSYKFQVSRELAISYKASMQGVTDFYAYYSIDGGTPTQANIRSGGNTWIVGQLDPGYHTLTMYATTRDYGTDTDTGELVGSKSNVLTFKVKILAGSYTALKPVTAGAIALYKASGRSNDTDKEAWPDESGRNTLCTLHDFNYTSNGFMTVRRDDFEPSTNVDEDLISVLRINAGAYAEIDIQPFLNNIPNGFTFEVFYRTENTGDREASVVNCMLENSPYTGFDINTYQASFRSELTGMTAPLSENVWTKNTFVVTRDSSAVGGAKMMIYTNGVITKVQYISSTENFANNTKKIILGARRNDANTETTNAGYTDIRSVRIYNKPLSHEEIVQNWIADEQNLEKQEAMYLKNYDESVMPRLYLTAKTDSLGSDKSLRIPCDVLFEDPMDPEKNFQLPGVSNVPDGTGGYKDATTISLQGTSSLAYNVKNFKLRLRDENAKKAHVVLKDTWNEENKFTLKADEI